MTTTAAETPVYRVPHHDVADALAQLKSATGFFVPSARALPVGASCRVEVVAPGQRESVRADAVVVGQRGGGLFVRAQRTVARTTNAGPAASTREMLGRVEALLRGDAVAFDLPSSIDVGDRVRITYGTASWPATISFSVVVRACARAHGAWRCDVVRDGDADLSQLHVFVARMQTLQEARDSSESFPRWRRDARGA